MKRKPYSIYIKVELMDKVDKIAKKEERSRNFVIEKAIESLK